MMFDLCYTWSAGFMRGSYLSIFSFVAQIPCSGLFNIKIIAFLTGYTTLDFHIACLSTLIGPWILVYFEIDDLTFKARVI